MAAALFRRRSCINCLHRELCRVVWRPQAALLSSKPSERKPRRTHIRKAKPQPALDVAQLLEQLFSQKRPGTAPPGAAKDVSHFSKKNPSVSVFPASATTSSLHTAPLSPQPTPASSMQPPPGFIQGSAAEAVTTASAPPASGSTAASAEGQTSAQTIQTKVETAMEPSTESTHPLVEALETQAPAVEGPVEPLIDFTVETKAADSGQVVQPAVETSIAPQETSQRAAAPERSAESMIPVMEAPGEVRLPPVEHSASDAGSVETIETAEAPVKRGQVTGVDLGVVDVSYTTTGDPSLETTVGPSGDTGPVVTLDTTIEAKAAETEETTLPPSAAPSPSVESPVEPPVEFLTSALQREAAVLERTVEVEHSASNQNAQEPPVSALETKVESTVEPSSGSDEESEAEQMTLESVTLHSVKTSVDSWKTDALLQTKFTLDERTEEQLQGLLVGGGHKAAAEAENSGEGEGEVLSDVLSRWSSLPDDLRELEGETATLMTELVCGIPAGPAETDEEMRTSEIAAASVACSQVEEGAMTLESITLSEVEAEVENLATEVLQETRDVLEKEADALAKEEKMEEKRATEDAVHSDAAEAEISMFDSISEAADVIEAEIPLVMEAMFFSEQEPRPESQPPWLLQDETSVGQRAGKQPAQQEGAVVAAMSLESVTLAEVEASLGSLEHESLSEAAVYLEKEAEAVAEETKTEVEDGAKSEEITEAVDIESLSLSEDLQTDALMEELLFTVPVQIAGADEAQRDQEKTSDELDPVQRLFLEKIREYNNLRRSSGGPVAVDSDYERHLSEEMAKLQRVYGGGGGGDLSSFPQFTFSEPEMDQDPK